MFPDVGHPLLPRLKDHERAELGVPQSCIAWPLTDPHSGGRDADQADELVKSVLSTNAIGSWDWPDRPVVFVSDLHADAEGFLRSLIASGALTRDGKGLTGLELTAFGRSALIIIGGDCLDKGPSNLDLLHAIKRVMDLGAEIRLLAGNHDLRLLLGVRALVGERTPLNEHMFVRMGNKVLPLLREVFDLHVDPDLDLKTAPKIAECRNRIFPGAKWERHFRVAAADYLNEAAIEKELKRLRKKVRNFEEAAENAGLNMRQLYVAAAKCQSLFLDPHGPYGWFYREMKALYQAGSLLFIHAGMDDAMARELAETGAKGINRRFEQQSRENPFTFYSSSIGNLMRTKYRPVDKPLTAQGVRHLHDSGVKLLVHGHVNRAEGQRLKSMQGLLHLEGDITLDRHSRKSEGLDGIGTGCTIIYPSGDIVGLSRDFPHAKVFNPAAHGAKGILQS
ncbi:calcineurin-like phosphoesterase family protein [Roseibium hamelinense]|uniref:Calcineurin-like phosphoesterase family protein n=1 Tax=Roseibium hamelinense TaxID=150831 RepID=A0A562TH29_9HYPH|nr:metallophosphoesterase [Roseibium hamelinense]MTI45943.1 metallophosphoesterase [Roseibium hamelinense]TWI92872.1 calcineurin-like phosphoesterase family protein [Roseibium hamelinense]